VICACHHRTRSSVPRLHRYTKTFYMVKALLIALLYALAKKQWRGFAVAMCSSLGSAICCRCSCRAPSNAVDKLLHGSVGRGRVSQPRPTPWPMRFLSYQSMPCSYHVRTPPTDGSASLQPWPSELQAAAAHPTTSDRMLTLTLTHSPMPSQQSWLPADGSARLQTWPSELQAARLASFVSAGALSMKITSGGVSVKGEREE